MKSSILIHAILILVPIFANAVPLKFAVEGGAVEALVIGRPSLLKIKATGESAKGTLTVDGKKVDGIFEFALSTLDSGIELRDDHMKNKYLKVSSHPKAVLAIRDLQLATAFSSERPEVSETEFNGDLTLHGVTKAVKGKFKVGDDRKISADFKLKLTDFQIEIPSYMGITVADEVNVRVLIDNLRPAM